ncbi:unnamed protein product, partial [Phaeothamnion confervicola]
MAEGSDGRQSVFCVGPDVPFCLRRHRRDGPYMIEAIGHEGTGSQNAGASFGFVTGRFLNAPFVVQGVPVTRMMADPNFSITSKEVGEYEGDPVVRVSYKYQHSKNAQPTYDVNYPSGWFEVAPSKGWAVVRAYRKGSFERADFPQETKVEYAAPEGDRIVPISVVQSDGPGEKILTRFDRMTFADSDADEFTLPYFGLPNIDVRADDALGWSTSALLLGTGIITMIVA